MTLEELKRLEQAATAGPWAATTVGGSDLSVTSLARKDGENCVVGGCGCCGSPWCDEPDAALIAAARNALPALIGCAEVLSNLVEDAYPGDFPAARAALARLNEVKP